MRTPFVFLRAIAVLQALISTGGVSGQLQEWHDANKLLLQLHPSGWIGGVNPTPESVPGLGYPCCPANILFHDYLWDGGIWLGGVVNGDSLVIASMNRCYYGNNGRGFWFKEPITELPFPDGQLYYTVYADSTTGVEVQQESYALSSPSSFRDFIILDLEIANLGSNSFEQIYLGIYFNGIGISSAYNQEICGVRSLVNGPSDDTAYLGWVADNDGNPVNGNFDANSPTSVVGVKILYPRAGDCRSSFNWWRYKWGPTLQSNFATFGYMTDTSLGEATTCREKYYLMSNGEIDYDQNLSHLNHTNNGWLPPPANGIDIARGANSAFLLSCGPLGDFLPGDTIRFAYAVIGAENFHYNTLYDTLLPEYTWYDFSGLENNALTAQRLYDSLFNPPTDVNGQETPPIPKNFALYQNYPNPFNRQTTISYSLPKSSTVTLEIFNLRGQLVRRLMKNEVQSPGSFSVNWDGLNAQTEEVASGIYFYRLTTSDFSEVRKMTSLK